MSRQCNPSHTPESRRPPVVAVSGDSWETRTKANILKNKGKWQRSMQSSGGWNVEMWPKMWFCMFCSPSNWYLRGTLQSKVNLSRHWCVSTNKCFFFQCNWYLCLIQYSPDSSVYLVFKVAIVVVAPPLFRCTACWRGSCPWCSLDWLLFQLKNCCFMSWCQTWISEACGVGGFKGLDAAQWDVLHIKTHLMETFQLLPDNYSWVNGVRIM